MSVDNTSTIQELLEECDQIIAAEEHKLARNAAYRRIVDALAALGIDRELIMIAGDVIGVLERCGVTSDAMTLDLFVMLSGDRALTELVSERLGAVR